MAQHEKLEPHDPRELLRRAISKRKMYFSEDTFNNTFSFLLGFVSGAEMYSPNSVGRVWYEFTSWMYYKYQLANPSLDELKDSLIDPSSLEALFKEFCEQADIFLLHRDSSSGE